MKFNKLNVGVLSMGSAALIVSAGAMAGAPQSPVSLLVNNTYNATTGYGTSGLNYAIQGVTVGTGGSIAGATFDSNGDLVSLASACNSGNTSCQLLDGSGDGMLQYLIKDTNGKSHVEMIVGTDTAASGLFLSDTFVEYSGGTSLDSMANKMIIEDAAALANTGSVTNNAGFILDAEWRRGDYQTQVSSEAFNHTLANGGNGADLDSIVDMTVGGVQTFHMDGLVSENGALTAGAGNDVDIQQGTTFANTSQVFGEAAAMGVFESRTQGGDGYNGSSLAYNPFTTATTLTLGGATLGFTTSSGVQATYIQQQGQGYYGFQSENFGVQHPELVDFAYLSVKAIGGNGTASAAIGTYTNPLSGNQPDTGSIMADTQNNFGGPGLLVQANAANASTTTPINFLGQGTTVGDGTISTQGNYNTPASTAGEFLQSNIAPLTGAWSQIFGTAEGTPITGAQ